ncbi:MAG: molybdopterin-dependent oxidoreductase [Bacteroidetes bacterium]|nr:molybdopterin-dependent oxidoreductase [Bacteroidota bacterium]
MREASKEIQRINVTVTVDGRKLEVPEGFTVLQASRKSGSYIPTLCYLDNLPNYGGCRLCMVEIKNMRGFPTACTTPVTQGMEIITKTDELQALRRDILELLLTEHPYTCLVCGDKNDCGQYMHSTRKVGVTTGCNFCTSNGDCELQNLVDYLELTDMKFPISYRNVAPVRDNPFYELDYNLCVLCGRCVRICNDERHSKVLAFVQRGNSTLVGTAFNESQKDAGCEYCGACVDVCPTGSLSEKMGSWVGLPDRSISTTCVSCSIGCEMNINTKGERVVNVGPAPGKRTDPPQLCVRGKFVPPDIIHHPARITSPLIKKENRWAEVGWKEAIHYSASHLEQFRGNRFGMIGSAQDTIENNYILQKFARKIMRSNNVDLLSSYPEKELIKNINDYHKVFPPFKVNDITDADTVFLIGSRAYLSHPIIENKIRKAYSNGRQVVAASTHNSRTTDFTSYHTTYSPGGESAFLSLLLFSLARKTKSPAAKEILRQLKDLEIHEAMARCGITPGALKNLSDIIFHSGNTVIIVGDEILRNADCLNSFNALVNLQLLLDGHCRMMFLLDEGNRYGGTYVGMHPYYLAGFDELDDEKTLKKWSHQWQTKLNQTPGYSSDEMIKKINGDGISALFIVGDIPPDKRLSGLSFLVQQNMFFTETSKFANVFFPLTSHFEDSGHIMNLEGELKKNTRVIQPLEGTKPVWQVISEISDGLNETGFNYKQPEDIFTDLCSLIDLTFTSPAKNVSKVKPLTTRSVGNNDLPVSLIIEPNAFHYFGNILSAHIPDMKSIRDEGILFISALISEQLSLIDGKEVNIITGFGKINTTVRINHELEGNIAFFRPTWEHISSIADGINIDQYHIPVKIEDLRND